MFKLSNPRRIALRSTAALCAALAAPQVLAQSQSAYPNRAVKLVVGSPPGGPSDFLARMMAEHCSTAFSQSFVVENKPGASGAPAADSVAKAAADGHTLLVSGPASIVSVPQFTKTGYEPLMDFSPVTMMGAGAFVLVVHPSVPVNSVAELVALAKSKPEAMTYGSGGNGSSGHLLTELFSSLAGVRMQHVPYKGDGQAVIDLMSGQVQVMFTAPNVAMPHVKSGKLKLLAVTSRERVASMPDTPTIAETAIKDFEYLGWIIVFAPSATPASTLDALAAVWQKARAAPAVKTKLDELAMGAPERYWSRQALGPFLRTEYDRLGKVIRDANIKA